MKHIHVENRAGQPKYKQIVKSIEESLLSGILKKGDKLPSINEVKNKFSLSRDTVLMAFNELKMRGIIESFSGKGYYVKSLDTDVTKKIFVLFDELNAFKEDLYNSFLESFTSEVEVDIYFHHFNKKVFEKLVVDSIGNYHFYVIMPANLVETESVIKNLPSERVYILDQFPNELQGYPSVHQDFENDMYRNLVELKPRLAKYKNLNLIFSKFKSESGLNLNVYSSSKEVNIESESAFLVLDDRDLFQLLKTIKEKDLILGQQVGVVSYNDTLYKEIIEGGITTITTDFREMGEHLANMIKQNEKKNIINPNILKVRKSL